MSRVALLTFVYRAVVFGKTQDWTFVRPSAIPRTGRLFIFNNLTVEDHLRGGEGVQ